jgi:phosphotransferase system enzyme I (PtsI)
MERALPGLGAAAGVAIGPACLIRALASGDRAAGTPDGERAALGAAIRAATAEVAALAAAQSGDAAEILGFQVAMLEDDALAEGAFAVIC